MKGRVSMAGIEMRQSIEFEKMVVPFGSVAGDSG